MVTYEDALTTDFQKWQAKRDAERRAQHAEYQPQRDAQALRKSEVEDSG